MIGLLKNKSQYYRLFFLVRDGDQYKEFLLFTLELFHFTEEILPLLPKECRTPYSRILSVPNNYTSDLNFLNLIPPLFEVR